jgi:SAM-dependent methyltransferase
MLRPYERLSQFYDIDWGDFPRQYVDLVNELLHERSIVQARVLDIACGTGILAICLAESGHIVQGIDSSPEMISIAKSKSIGMSNLSFEVQDMARFSVNGKFDLISCTFDSINYILKPDDLKKMLGRVASALYQGGLFIFDSNTKVLYLNHSRRTHKRVVNGQSFIHHCRYDAAHNVATTSFSFSDGTYEVHKQRPYDYDELAPLLEAAGLHAVHLFSWFQRLPYSSNTPKLFCVAEKHL